VNLIVKADVTFQGSKSSERCIALVDTGAAMTVVDKKFADSLGVEYTGRKRSLTSATGHRLEGKVAIFKELKVEDEILDYEKALVVEFNDEVREALRKLDVSDSMIIVVVTLELANFIPDTNTGKLKKIETFLF